MYKIGVTSIIIFQHNYERRKMSVEHL